MVPGVCSGVGGRKGPFEERSTLSKGSLVLGRQVLCRIVRMGYDDLPHSLHERSLDDSENLITIQVPCCKDEIMGRQRAQHASYLWKYLVLVIDDSNRFALD